jgi:hypothetical protein
MPLSALGTDRRVRAMACPDDGARRGGSGFPAVTSLTA